MARVKHIVGWVSVLLLVVTLASIWILTEQNVEQTSSLSESTAHVVEGQVADARPGGAGEARATDAAEGADPAAGIRVDPLAPVRMWLAANIRRVAHTVEFFCVGLFSAAATACLGERILRTRLRRLLVLLFCVICSVGDQVHKIFVPGRHFDVVDLGFDAAGYIVAMLLVLLVATLTASLSRRAARPIGAHARR